MESFSEQLRREAEPIWERVFSHPFLREIKDGSLPLEKFRYYLGQDYLYLEGFARAVAMTLAKAPDSQTLEELSHRVLTPIERPLHHQLLAAAGVTVEEIQRNGRSPTNTAYVNHMLQTASLHGLGPTAAALLPCPWTYHEVGQQMREIEHPIYKSWAAIYQRGFLAESVEAWRWLVDEASREAGEAQRRRMEEAFLISSRYEYQFWEMAWQQQRWPV